MTPPPGPSSFFQLLGLQGFGGWEDAGLWEALKAPGAALPLPRQPHCSAPALPSCLRAFLEPQKVHMTRWDSRASPSMVVAVEDTSFL